MLSLTRFAPTIRRPRKGPLAWLLALDATYRQRRALADLDDHLLRDIGITREEARKEARIPPWDAPAHWS